MLQCVTHGVGCSSSTFCNSLGIGKEVNERETEEHIEEDINRIYAVISKWFTHRSLAFSLFETKRYENTTAIAVLIDM